MKSALAPVVALLLSAALLVTGNGLQGLVIPLRGQLEGFSTLMIGTMAAVFYFGFMVGCAVAPKVLRRVGHIRSFTALAAIVGVSVLLLALAPDPVAWILLRGVIGFSLAILYTTIESWLNDKVPNRQRGQVLSVYMMINLLAMAAGQMLFPLLDVASIVPFVLIAIPMILSLVPVSLSTATQPNPPSTIRLDLRALYRLSPLALIGCFAIGLANGAFWGLAPLFARSILADSLGVSLFMTSAVIGGAAAQWPLGFLSDRVDRRFVIAGVGFAAAIGGAALTVGSGLSLAPLCLLAAGFGACLFPLYSLCVAHANDFAPAEDFVATSGGLLLVYGIAAAIGPLAASAVMEVLGPGGVFVWAGAVHCIVAVYAVFRMRKRRAKSADARAALVPLTKTTPAAFEIDPRAARKAD